MVQQVYLQKQGTPVTCNLPIYREWIITRRMQTLHQTSPLRIAWRRIQECNGHGFQRGRQALQIFNKREVCAIFVLLPVTGNGCVFIRINNRGCGVGSVFQRRKQKMGHSLKYSVEYGLKACLPYYGKSVERIIAYLPAIPNMRKNIQYLTEQELTAIRHTLEHDGTISLQDKAIITLAMYTGLRGCDISALTLENFDWEHDLIKITQAKTGQPLTLPLRAVVGNAVFDYLLKERPQCPEPYVFLTVHVPHRRLHTSNLDAICSKVMYKAGIRQGENERKSMHLFRHHVATSLLQGGVQQPVISATLGHSSPSSLDRYLSAEFKHLKECSLSIEGFPVGKEVFGR